MAIETINIGTTANDGTGDTLRDAGQKINDNFGYTIANGNSFKNKVINGGFTVNQRGVSGTVVLALGQYGHDRFMGGFSGGSYTFATVDNKTTITIISGTIGQLVEDVNIQPGDYVLSWDGTAQARINSGDYGNSGEVKATLDGSTYAILEFGLGTLSNIQLEKSDVATQFEERPLGIEKILCYRYAFKSEQKLLGIVDGSGTSGNRLGVSLPVDMRINPSVVMINNLPLYDGVGVSTVLSITNQYTTKNNIEFDCTMSAPLTAGNLLTTYENGNGSYLLLDAEII